jgi:phosphoribosylanthranilate isomerase
MAGWRGSQGGAVAVLLDTAVGGQKGGSGQQFDWATALALQERGYPVLVAGGLRPDNVREALRAAKPAGVDVSGGLETETPGVKDHAKVQMFLRAVRGTTGI